MLSIFQFDYILIFLQSITDDISEEHITMIFEGLEQSSISSNSTGKVYWYNRPLSAAITSCSFFLSLFHRKYLKLNRIVEKIGLF